MKECEDKNSTHYFMCHMSQEEFDERRGDGPIDRNFKFNRIQPERSKREDFLKEKGLDANGLRKQRKLEPCSVPLGRCGALNTTETP